jgi:hypothetical protein
MEDRPVALGFNIGSARQRAQLAKVALIPALFVASAAAQTADPADAQGPLIRIAEREVDLGTVIKGDNPEARFSIENVGTEPLRILKVQPG